MKGLVEICQNPSCSLRHLKIESVGQRCHIEPFTEQQLAELRAQAERNARMKSGTFSFDVCVLKLLATIDYLKETLLGAQYRPLGAAIDFPPPPPPEPTRRQRIDEKIAFFGKMVSDKCYTVVRDSID